MHTASDLAGQLRAGAGSIDALERGYYSALTPAEQGPALALIREHDQLRAELGMARRGASGLGFVPLLIGAAVAVAGGGFLGWRVATNSSAARELAEVVSCREQLLTRGRSLDQAVKECRMGGGSLTWLIVGVAAGVVGVALLSGRRQRA